MTSKRECFGQWVGNTVCEKCMLETWCADFTARSEREILERYGFTREDDEAMWQEHVKQNRR